jgi:hypothetical protein
MPAQSSIVVDDRESTPVAHTFAPRGSTADIATYREAGTVPVGEPTLTVRSRKSNGQYYVRLVLTVPVVVTETISGVDRSVVERVSLVDANFRFHESSTLQERKNVVGMFSNMLSASQAQLNPVLTELDMIW